jgi:hypothetical protein
MIHDVLAMENNLERIYAWFSPYGIGLPGSGARAGWTSGVDVKA